MERKTCILADNHEVVRSGTRLHLESVEWLDIIGEASTGADTLELVRRLKPDLALLDRKLCGDGLDGIAVTATMSAEHLLTRTVIFSGCGRSSLVEQALAAGAFGYVLKNGGFAMVVEALRCASIGQRFIDPSMAAQLLCPAMPKLSPREHEILQLMSTGQQNGVIAFDLDISVDTVKAHVSKILNKLESRSRTEAVATGFRTAIIH